MRICYAIILGAAAVSFEGCKVEKADAAVANENKKLKPRTSSTGGGGSLETDPGEGDGKGTTEKQTASQTKAAAVAKAKSDLDKAVAAREAAKVASVTARNQLIEAVIRIPRLQPTEAASEFMNAVRGVGDGQRSRESLQAAFTALGEIEGELPTDVQDAQDTLSAAIAAELASDGPRIAAGRELVRAIKEIAAVQFVISPQALEAAIALAENVRGAANNVDALQAALLAAIPAPDPDTSVASSVAPMFQQLAALRALIDEPAPVIAGLRGALVDLLTNRAGNTPQNVIDIWNPLAADPTNADFTDLLRLIGETNVPAEGDYVAVREAATRLSDAISLRDRIAAARATLLESIVPVSGLPVPVEVIAAVPDLDDEGVDAAAKIAALTRLRQAIPPAIGGPVAAIAAAYDSTISQIDRLPAATDAAEQACEALFGQLFPADPLHVAIGAYNTAVSVDGVTDEAREIARQTLIGVVEQTPVDSRVSVLTQYAPYTQAKAADAAATTAVGAARAAVEKLEKPTADAAAA
jgi:hypothetical protein